MMKLKIILKIVPLILFLFTIPLIADGEENTSVTVKVDGIAEIIDENTAVARESAINDSLKKAVEQAVETIVSAEKIVQNSELLQEKIYPPGMGYIESYKIISEKPTGNLYQVTSQVTVGTSTLRDDLTAIGLLTVGKDLPLVMVMMDESYLGEDYNNSWYGVNRGEAGLTIAGTTIIEKLRDKGFTLVGPMGVGREFENFSAFKIYDISDEDIISAGNRYDAHVVVYGKSLSKITEKSMDGSAKTVRAVIYLRAFNTSDGKIIASVSGRGSAVHDIDVMAGTEAIRNAVEEISDDLLARMVSGWKEGEEHSVVVKMSVSGIASYGTFMKFTDILKNSMKSITSVHERGFASGQAHLELESSKSAQYIADQLTMIEYDGFSVDITDIKDDSIDINIKMD